MYTITLNGTPVVVMNCLQDAYRECNWLCLQHPGAVVGIVHNFKGGKQ